MYYILYYKQEYELFIMRILLGCTHYKRLENRVTSQHITMFPFSYHPHWTLACQLESWRFVRQGWQEK